jgi:MFS family permease
MEPQATPPKAGFSKDVNCDRISEMPKTRDQLVNDSFVVDWNGCDDPNDPFNWPLLKKIAFTVIGSCIVFAVTFASSDFGPAGPVVASEYGVSVEVTNLSVALFVAGFAAGPLLFAPLSQIYGHAAMLLTGLIGCAIFQIPLALAQNIETVIISRFLMGAIGSAVLAVGSGMLAEVWGPSTRAVAIGLSATSMNMGSIVGPIAGSFVLSRYGWRWIGWMTLLVCVGIGATAPFALRESSRQIILDRKASQTRKKMNDSRYQTLSEREGGMDFSLLAQRYFKLPLQMITREPILIIITIYLTLVYGTLYLSYQMFPFAFQHRGWSAPMSSLPFISVLLGVLSAWLVSSWYTIAFYRPKHERTGLSIPEDRLPPMILGGFILPPALLWFGWSMRTNWFCQVMSCFFVGFSLQLIFITGVVYIIDVYLTNANSAISIHVGVRSLVSASFPLWGPLLYRRLGIEWTSTLLACLGLLLLPSPLVFYYWGRNIRSWSRLIKSNSGLEISESGL